jgi:outer membrane protein assembly factor BamB
VVAGGRAYLRVTPSSEDGKTVEDLVVCVGLDDGREVWTFRQPGGGAKYGAPNMPCVASGRLYFVGSQGTVFCLDAATGRELWRTPLDIKGESYSSSVAVVDGKVVVADTQLLALDAGTGAKVWANPAIKAHHNSPAVWRHGGKTYLLAGHGNPKDKTTWKTCCVDLAGGKELWQAAGGCYASPVVSGDYLAMLYWETGLKVYQMTPAAATDLGGAALASDDNQSCTAAVKDGKVYGFAAKEAFCYDIGKKDFAWRIPVSAKSGSPVITDGKVLQAASKTLRMFEAATGKDLGPAKGVNVGIVGHSSPALADGKLLVNAGTHLRCYDLAKH